jgi:hypothetical protein
MNVHHAQEVRGLERGMPGGDEEVWLRGQPPLADYLDFMEELAATPEPMPRAKLIDEWRAADDYYETLETAEAGIADGVELRPLDAALRPLARKLRSAPGFRRNFDSLPSRFAMVELDRLIVGRPYVGLQNVARLHADLGPAPDATALFDFCLARHRREAPPQMRKTGSRSFLFWTPSPDFGFREMVSLRPDQVRGHDFLGVPGGIVAAMLEHGPDFLSLIQHGKRLLVRKGLDRAYALRALGITHAPCIVSKVTRFDELKLVASSTVVSDPAFYFVAKRPPILKDFFDPNIRKLVPVHPMMNMIEVSVEVTDLRRIRAFDHAI